MISDLGKYIYYTVSSRKSSDSFFLLTLKGSIDTIEEQMFWINQSSSFFKNIIRKKMKWSFFKHRKRRSVLSGIYPNKILWLLRTQRDLPSRIRQTWPKKGVGPIEFLRFHVDNSIHPITTGMNPIRNMNHKRKCLLNRSQEYQLQYLLAKEESFQ